MLGHSSGACWSPRRQCRTNEHGPIGSRVAALRLPGGCPAVVQRMFTGTGFSSSNGSRGSSWGSSIWLKRWHRRGCSDLLAHLRRASMARTCRRPRKPARAALRLFILAKFFSRLIEQIATTDAYPVMKAFLGLSTSTAHKEFSAQLGRRFINFLTSGLPRRRFSDRPYEKSVGRNRYDQVPIRLCVKRHPGLK